MGKEELLLNFLYRGVFVVWAFAARWMPRDKACANKRAIFIEIVVNDIHRLFCLRAGEMVTENYLFHYENIVIDRYKII